MWHENCMTVFKIFKRDFPKVLKNRHSCLLLSGTQLVHNAVPTIFSFPPSLLKLPSKRKPPAERITAVITAKKLKSGLEESVTVEPTDAPCTPSSDATPRKALLFSKLKYAQSSLARARVALFRRKSKPNTAPSVHSASLNTSSGTSQSDTGPCMCNICVQLQSLPDVKRLFICSQLASQHVSKFGIRYSDNDKLFALGLFYKSPAAYRFMNKSFQLPSERTLREYVGQFSVRCGFDSDYCKALEKHVGCLSDYERCCVLTFDGSTVNRKTEC